MTVLANNDADIRERFQAARQRGLRAKEAAEAIGLTEGAALAACVALELPCLDSLPASTPLAVYPLKPDWVELLRSLEVCGPLMALTRNASTVHEKTGVYQKVSGNEVLGLALGPDIDLRLFFGRWSTGLLVLEPGAANASHPKTSLQFFDGRGVAVHKIFPVPATERGHWNTLLAAWVDAQQPVTFDPSLQAIAPRGERVKDPAAFAADWAAMTDVHQFFGLLKQHDVERLPALGSVQGRFTRRVAASALRDTLYHAAFTGLPVMIFVGNPGCIQIHSGTVQRIEPMDIKGQAWLNVLDPGFNLHLREDLIEQCWVVEKPTADGIITSLEVFDAQGDVMAMCFGKRKPGQAELQSWKDALAELPTLNQEPAHVA